MFRIFYGLNMRDWDAWLCQGRAWVHIKVAFDPPDSYFA